MKSSALIDGVYRYRLSREWREGARVCFIMLNPSTADAEQDDPTIRRCISFAKGLGAGALDVVNLFALRATDPAALIGAPDAIGPLNMSCVVEVATSAEMVICAWGAHRIARHQAGVVLNHLRATGVKPLCLRQTKDGHPAHPLRLPSSLRPVPLEARGDSQ